MDGALPVLPEEDLVDVGVHQVRLGEVRIERHRHERLAHLARQRLARVQEVAAHQLLRERARALLDLPGARVHPQGAQDPGRVHPVVRVELAVLDRLQRRRQQRRHLVRGDHDAILAVAREDAADQQRLQAQHRHLVAGGIAQPLECARAGGNREHGRRAALIGKACRAQRHLQAGAHEAVAARVLSGVGTLVVQALQLVLEFRRREFQACVQFQRRCVHLRRQRPAPALELLGHQVIPVPQVTDAGRQQHGGAEQQRAPRPLQPAWRLQRNSSGAGSRKL